MSDSGAGGDDVVRSAVLVVLSVVILEALLAGCSFSGVDEAWPLVREYSIGETGPAGGVIFYDKGGRDDGWRYLEAGPVDLQPNVFWNINQTSFLETGYGIGSGESNTILIVDSLGGESTYAPQQCLYYVTGPFDDWFLPSHDELIELFLQRNAMGEFLSDRYWSSTEDGDTHAWTMDFTTELPLSVPKDPGATQVGVRPIRAF